jgi:pyruvate dehydrogenase E1 component alpha subunit
VDGNDVLAVHAVTLEALERARTGGGPTFIEAFTYRMGAHTTSDDPTRYRSHAEEDYWRQRDPIDRLRILLTAEGMADDAFFAEVEAEADAVGEATRTYCRSLGDPPASLMFDHVYSAPHPLVAEERAWFERYEQSFVSEGGA